MKNVVFILLGFFIYFTACDEIDGPYVKDNPPVDTSDNDSSVIYKKVLVEDFTAHLCTYCPRAHRKIDELKEVYGTKIIPVALHVSQLAMPLSGAFGDDFRTPQGEEIDAFYHISNAGLPQGLINRTEMNGTRVLPFADWSGAIAQEVAEKAFAGISIYNNYNFLSRNLHIIVNTNFITDTVGEFYLCVYFIEDSIISGQKDTDAPGGQILNYVHNHVVRAFINGTWGEMIEDTVENKDNFVKEYNYHLLPEIVPEHCSVVAFIRNQSDEGEIIQAEIEKVMNSR